MPIFCTNVNQVYQEKLVPITRHNGASSVPDEHVSALKLVEGGPENGTLWELEAETPNVGRRYLVLRQVWIRIDENNSHFIQQCILRIRKVDQKFLFD